MFINFFIQCFIIALPATCVESEVTALYKHGVSMSSIKLILLTWIAQ